MVTSKQSQIYGNFWQILNLCQELLADYEHVISDEEAKKKFNYIENVYVDALIVHLAKLFSPSRNEAFRLGTFKTILRPELRNRVEDMEISHTETIAKILMNRDKLVAHLDEKFYDIPFSERQIKEFEEDMVKRMRVDYKEAAEIYKHMPRAEKKRGERYSLLDFREDTPLIKEMLIELKSVWNDSVPFPDSN
jgi:hypothetical protein